MSQMPSIPYASPRMYDSDRGTDRLIDLMLRRGDVEARGRAASGAIWGRAFEDVGQIAAGAVQQYGEQKQQKKREEVFNQAVQTFDPQNPMAFYRQISTIYPPREAAQVTAGVSNFMSVAEKAKRGEDPTMDEYKNIVVAAGINEKAFPGFLENNYPNLVLLKRGAELYDGYRMSDDPTPEEFAMLKTSVLAKAAEWATKKPETPEERYAMSKAGAEGTAAGTPVKPPALQTLTVPGPNGPMAQSFTPEQVAAGVPTYKAPPASLVINPQKEADSKANAQMMVDGRALPTTFSKRGTDFNHLIAEADKLSREQTGKGFNPIKLQLDFEASKRFVGALNSSQMVRFKGLAVSVVNTIDEVKMLAEQLKQGGVQKWNQAKRDTILQVYGNTPQSALAAQYISAVNTLKEEFANLAQGGYAPTEAAWKLAEQQINGNYGLKDFNASVTEAQRLINYRLGAFDELTPSLLGGGGQSFGGAGQGATPAGGPKELTYNPNTGKLE